MSVALTPTAPERTVRWGDFATLVEAMDYAATQPTGINLYALRGQLAEVLPYARLREEARDIAGQLLAQGLEPGDRVGLAAATDGDFLRAFFACQYAGLVPAPLPLPAPFGGRAIYTAHVRRMLETCRAAAAFAPPELAPWFEEAAQGLALRVCGAFPRAGEGRDAPSLPAPDPQGLALLQFSSGSTRFPMGIEITQAALIANASITAVKGLACTAQDRALSWLPLYHDMGLVGFVLMPFLAQLSMDLMPTAAFVRRPLLWPELISANGATLSYSPSFGYDLAARRVDAETLARLDLSRWRVAGVGGDMLRPEPLRAFADGFAPAGFNARAFTASYGMAEATLAVSMTVGRGLRTETVGASLLAETQLAEPVDGGEAGGTREFAWCGRVLAGHRLEVRGEDGRGLPERTVGRIFVAGPSLMRGYFDRPQESAQAVSADGWLDTGDLGYLVDDELVVTGRAKDLIIVNGRNLWPQDLEWTLEDGVPELRTGDVAVFSVWQGGEERVVVVAERRGGEAANDDDLKTRIGDLVRSRHGVAVETLLVKSRSLPMTSSGKLSRTKAREMYEAGAFVPAAGG